MAIIETVGISGGEEHAVTGPEGQTEVTLRWAADELGPEKVVCARLPLGCVGIVVVDNTALGTAIGGVRMNSSVDGAEVARLARAMTVKNAVARLPHGGGKAGIRTPGALEPADRERVVRGFAQAIRDLTDYTPGPDMGTDETAMAWVQDEIGRAVGLPSILGGIPLDELGATGFGLAVCAEVLDEAGLLDLDGARVVVQGFGAVGQHAALRLAERGAVVVGVSDSRGATYQADGLDVAALVAFKREQAVSAFPGGRPMPRDELLCVECDVLVPAAQPDVVTEENVQSLRASFVLEGANIPVTPAAELLLHRREVLVVPDVVANAGGVICAAVELHGGDRDQAFAAIRSKIGDSTRDLLARIGAGDLPPRAAALQMGRDRVLQAAPLRRRF